MVIHWRNVFLILVPCALLFVVALTIVATVLVSSRHSFDTWRRIKSALAVLVWIVPAAAIVAWVGVGHQPRWRAAVVSPSPSAMALEKQAELAVMQREQLIVPDAESLRTHDYELANQGRLHHRKAPTPPPQPLVAIARNDSIDSPSATQSPPTNADVITRHGRLDTENSGERHAFAADSAQHESQSGGILPGDSATTADSARASVPRLKVRQISSDDPKWTTAANIVNGRELVVLSSQRFATLAEAEENVTSMALQRIREHWSGETLLDFSGSQLRWPQSLRGEDVRQAVVEVVDRFAVKDLVGEVMDWDFKNGTTGKMYRAHLRLDFTPQLHDALQDKGRAVIVEGRLLHLSGLLGLVTLMLGTAAGYFKLDDATAGAYRRRLKLAAAAVIAAGGLAATRVLGS